MKYKDNPKEYRRQYYLKNKEKERASNKKWISENKDKTKKIIRRYRDSEKGKACKKKCEEKRKLNNPEKYKANVYLKIAVYRNKIEKPSICPICGSNGQIDAHHHDYSKPYDVTWMCHECHVDLHKGKELI